MKNKTDLLYTHKIRKIEISPDVISLVENGELDTHHLPSNNKKLKDNFHSCICLNTHKWILLGIIFD